MMLIHYCSTCILDLNIDVFNCCFELDCVCIFNSLQNLYSILACSICFKQWLQYSICLSRQGTRVCTSQDVYIAYD